jgi:hypothetical protein
MKSCSICPAAPQRPLPLRVSLGALAALGIHSGVAHADIAYDTITGHATGTLRGFGFGTIFAEDVTLEAGAGRTLTGLRMAAYSSTNYLGTMHMMFATRAPGDGPPDLDNVFATADITVSATSTVVTWIADLPFIEAPHQRLWVMWTFSANTLGDATLPAVGSDGGPPTAGSTNDTAYARRPGFTGWDHLLGERWVMRLDAIPAPSGVAFLGLVAVMRSRRCV